MKSSTSEFVPIRNRRYHVRRWGAEAAPRLFLLHGWMDCSASFQFLVDALAREWSVVAPDWRGFGLSEWNRDAYWFPDYLADLDALVERYAPGEPARLVGHSMGGNIACLYAGTRPARVSALATLEGFGLAPTEAAQAPERYAKWLDQLTARTAFRRFGDLAEFAQRLRRDNPRLGAEQAAFLAANFSMPTDDGGYTYAADPCHRFANPVLYRLEEAKACWSAITAPVLWVAARGSNIMREFHGREADYAGRLASFRRLREVVMEDCGHMMHHDQPQRLASLLEDFFANIAA